MSSIVDALKTVHPEATGDTIAEVIKTMGASGGGSASGGIEVIELTLDADNNIAEGTYQRIDDAFNAGKFVVMTIPSLERVAYLIGKSFYNGHDGYGFISFDQMYPNMMTLHKISWAGYDVYAEEAINLAKQ